MLFCIDHRGSSAVDLLAELRSQSDALNTFVDGSLKLVGSKQDSVKQGWADAATSQKSQPRHLLPRSDQIAKVPYSSCMRVPALKPLLA